MRGVSLEEKRLTVIKSWLAKTLVDVEKYTWEISVEQDLTRCVNLLYSLVVK